MHPSPNLAFTPSGDNPNLEAQGRAVKTFRSIQALRAVAALMVVVFHLASPARGIVYPDLDLRWGAAGVDIFFVISGFIIYVSQAQAAPDPAGFLKHRLIRVAPLYWLTTLALIGLHVTLGMHPDLVLSPGHVVQSLVFIPHFDPGEPSLIQPVLVQGWTLNYEFAFYGLFALALWLAPSRRILFVSGVLLAAVTAGLWLRPEGALARTFTDARLLEFVFGMLLGALARRDGAAMPVALGGLVPVGLVLLAVNPALTGGAEWVWIPLAALIVAGAVALDLSGRLAPPRWLLVLGDASYSIYLSHTIVQAFYRGAWRSLVPPSSEPWVFWLFFALGLLVSTAAGVALYYGCEKPLLGWMRRRLDGPRPARVSAQDRPAEARQGQPAA